MKVRTDAMLDGIGVGVSLGVEMHHVAGAEPCWRCDVVVRVSSCDGNSSGVFVVDDALW